MTYKNAKKINLSSYAFKFKTANVYVNTGSFSKQYQEARKAAKKLSKA
jgi:hypothetical protein